MQTPRIPGSRIHTTISSAPSPQVSPNAPSTILEYIESEISSLFMVAKANSTDESPPSLSRKAYLDIYTKVHEYDIATRAHDSGVANKYLHRWLESQIRDYCVSMRTRIFDGHNSNTDDSNASLSCNLLSTYMTCYRKFCRLATFVGNLLRSWERHGLRREKDEKTYVSSVEEMHQIVWREEILGVEAEGTLLNHGLRELKGAISVLTEGDVETSDHDPALVEDVIKSLSVLGITIDS